MAIKLDILSKENLQDSFRKYTYGDMHLDFILQSPQNDRYVSDPGQKKDIRVDYDLDAIKNSIKNIFGTKPGQKILNPRFGLDLTEYLFEQVSQESGEEIGEKILTQLSFYEPRINIKNISVTAITKQQQYNIDIVYSVPQLNNIGDRVKGVLDTQGFRYE